MSETQLKTLSDQNTKLEKSQQSLQVSYNNTRQPQTSNPKVLYNTVYSMSSVSDCQIPATS